MEQSIFFFTILGLGMAAYYSFVLLPRQREYKKRYQYVTALKVGDEVISSGGIIGTVTALDEEIGVARIRIAEGLEVRILAAALVRPYDTEELAAATRLALQEEQNAGQ